MDIRLINNSYNILPNSSAKEEARDAKSHVPSHLNPNGVGGGNPFGSPNRINSARHRVLTHSSRVNEHQHTALPPNAPATSSYTLDLTRMNLPASLQALPSDLQIARFENQTHALCFTKAVIYGDHKAAREIQKSNDPDRWVSLMENVQLTTAHRQQWGKDNGVAQNVMHQIRTQFAEQAQNPSTASIGPLQNPPAGLPKFDSKAHALYHARALFSGNFHIAQQIQNSHNPEEWRRLGRRENLRGFDPEAWNSYGRDQAKALIRAQIQIQKQPHDPGPLPLHPGEVTHSPTGRVPTPSPVGITQSVVPDDWGARTNAPFRFDLTPLGPLPNEHADLQVSTFKSGFHALCFAKALYSGNFDTARAIRNSQDPGKWTPRLPNFDHKQWDSSARALFQNEIQGQFNASGVRPYNTRNTRVPRDQNESWRNPHRDVGNLSRTLTEVNTRQGLVTCFYEPDSPFSNWHPSPFTDQNGNQYNCMEQYLFVQKYARLNEPQAAREIFMATNPEDQKALNARWSSTLSPQKQEVWRNGMQDQVLMEGNYYKYMQNPHLLEMLVLTEGRLIEAAPKDPIYGAKASVSSEEGMEAIRNGSWTGYNKLGITLTVLRDHLKQALGIPGNPENDRRLEALRSQYQPARF
jgi:ribA/ribD-fused uncharacterized protein